MNEISISVTQEKKEKRSVHVGRIFVYAALILYAIFIVAPFLTVIVTSLTPHLQLESTVGFVWKPKPITFSAYKAVFTEDTSIIFYGYSSMLRGFFNSIWQTCVPLVIGTFVSALAAYAYSKLNVPGKEKIYAIEIATMMIPLGAFQIVEMIFYAKLNWIGTALPLVIPGMFGSATTIFFFRSFFDGISNEILEAAKIDGCKRGSIILRITLPMIFPVITVMFIMQLSNIMNAGFDSVYNLYCPNVFDTADIIDTYAYRLFMDEHDYPLSSAVGIFKTSVNFVLLLAGNFITKKINGYSMFSID